MSLLSGVQGAWKFDASSGDALDSSGNGRTLTNTNTVGYAAGLIGNAADYGTSNGTNKTFIRTDGCGITGTGDMSVSFWIKGRTEIAAGSTVFFTNQTSGDIYHQFSYEFNAGTRRVVWNVGGTEIRSNLTIGTSNFVSIIATKTGTSAMELFVNNASVASGVPGAGTGGSDYTSFGATSGASNGPAAFIDIAYLSNTVVTARDRATLYNGGLGYQYPFGSGNFFTFMK